MRDRSNTVSSFMKNMNGRVGKNHSGNVQKPENEEASVIQLAGAFCHREPPGIRSGKAERLMHSMKGFE